MATALAKSSLRAALRGGARSNPAPKRNFSSSAGHDDAKETAKWEKITYAGIVSCTVLAFINLSKGHPHFEEPLHIHICIFATRSFHGARMAFLRLSSITEV